MWQKKLTLVWYDKKIILYESQMKRYDEVKQAVSEYMKQETCIDAWI